MPIYFLNKPAFQAYFMINALIHRSVLSYIAFHFFLAAQQKKTMKLENN